LVLDFGRGQEWITPGGYKFRFQEDGNLVLYDPQGNPTWATGTMNTGANRFVVQTDGNVVLYEGNTPLWATDTYGNPGAYFAIQSDGNLVVYASSGKALFSTDTVGGRVQTHTAAWDWQKKHTPPTKSGYVNSNVGSYPLSFRADAYVGATIIGKLSQGTSLKILKSVTGGGYTTPRGSHRDDWYQVEVNGKKGYVAAYYVSEGSSNGGGGNNGNEPDLHSNPTISNPLKGFSHPLKGQGPLTQGWNTDFSHKGSSAYAMDFDAFFGAPVYAMRSGTVIKVISHFADDGRNDPAWANRANLVYIDHGNGYVSRYLHLKQSSVVVREGDRVNAGQKIAEQGNSGWSTDSHLHVAVHNAQGNSVPFEIPGINP
jgi:hypothetical protein